MRSTDLDERCGDARSVSEDPSIQSTIVFPCSLIVQSVLRMRSESNRTTTGSYSRYAWPLPVMIWDIEKRLPSKQYSFHCSVRKSALNFVQ